MEFLTHAFSFVCGQNADHTWSPGGLLLPCCQRCTGLYLGALAAALLHLWLKPHPTNRFLAAHGLLLLQMVPFGFHWLPQGPVLRTITGILFGFGVVGVLWLLPAARVGMGDNSRTTAARAYWLGFAVSLAGVPAIAACGGQVSAIVLPRLLFAGALALSALVLANAAVLLGAFRRGVGAVDERAIAGASHPGSRIGS